MFREKKVKLTIPLYILVFICCCGMVAQGKYGGGSGTSEDPYQIWDANHMQAIGADSNDWDKCFELMADIDLSGYTGPGPWPPPTFARNPSPSNGSMIGDLDADLYWTAGEGAKSHDVYFGTSNPPPFIHNQTTTTFDPGTMAYFTKYYWRIDEFSNTGKTTGIVWSFTTILGPPPMSLMIEDVDLSNDIGKTFNIIGYFEDWQSPNHIPFTGVFDGGGHTISNFTYNCTDTEYIGLFGYVEGEIKDLGLLDPDIDVGTGGYVGSLVGVLRYGIITNCYVKGGSVSRAGHVGGLVGLNWRGIISNCYSNVSVSGVDYVGGLVASNYEGVIANCYSTGSVKGYQYIGGLMGDNWEGTVTFSFWDVETSGLTISAGGMGLATAQMQTVSTFIGWWCGSVWTIDEGFDYPRLWWEDMPGELIIAPSDLYGGGTGEPDDPYLIYTAEQLNSIGLIRCDWDKCFKLMADVDLGGFAGSEFNLIGRWIDSSHPDNRAFTGVFDGNGHTITNFSYTSMGRDSVGFFEYVSGEIKNLGLINPNIDAGTGNDVGSLVGKLNRRPFGGKITNCYSTGGVKGNENVGGLVGHNVGGTISDSYSNGNVSGHEEVGGIVGKSYYRGTITNCYSNSTVSGTNYVGGLVGYNGGYGGSTITNCYSTAYVTGGDDVGGLVGRNSSKITNCYSIGGVSGNYSVGSLVGYNSGTITNSWSNCSVSGDWRVGGLVGYNSGTITNSCSTGGVTGNYRYVGGLVGNNDYGTITNCYSTGSVTGNAWVRGLVGSDWGTVTFSFWDIETSGQTRSSGTGKTTAEMQTMSTFTDAGWDFVNIWWILEGVCYPRHRWEIPVLHAEPEVTLGTSNTISWEPVVGNVEYYAECAEDADFNSIVYNSGWITDTNCVFSGLELGKMYWYSVKARNAAGIESQWSDVEFSLQGTLTDAVEIMLTSENLKNDNMKRALLKKIDAAMKMFDEGMDERSLDKIENSLDKLENDILSKMDGCAEMGEPDQNDWIITCEGQNQIYPLVIETIEYIRSFRVCWPYPPSCCNPIGDC